MTSTHPTKVIAGVTIPDTPLITKVIEFARKHSSDFAFNHVQRTMLLGFVMRTRSPSWPTATLRSTPYLPFYTTLAEILPASWPLRINALKSMVLMRRVIFSARRRQTGINISCN
jgi:hypothetical protein